MPASPEASRRLYRRPLAALSMIGIVLSGIGPSPGAGAQEQFVLKLATSASHGSPQHEHMRAVARHLEEKTAGHLLVKVLAGGALGSAADVLPRLREGGVQAYAGSAGELSAIIPALSVLEAPHVFAHGNKAMRQLDGALPRTLAQELEGEQLLFASWSVDAPRMWWSLEPVRRPADLAKRRVVRTRSASRNEAAEALGLVLTDVAAVPLSPAALRDAKIEVLDDTLLAAAATGRDRWARHLNTAEHARSPWLLVYSSRWFEGLPEQIKQDVTELPASLLSDARAAMTATREPLLERLRKRGVEVHAPSAAEQRAFHRSGRAAANKLARSLGPTARLLLRAAGQR